MSYFEDKGITFNFISCDDDNDNDLNFDNDDLNIGGGINNNADGFESLLNDDLF